jgi:hypothetical protein
MTKEQLDELAAVTQQRGPDGECWYCKTVMIGHFPGCPVAALTRLLKEREMLLETVSNVRVSLNMCIREGEAPTWDTLREYARMLGEAITEAEKA